MCGQVLALFWSGYFCTANVVFLKLEIEFTVESDQTRKVQAPEHAHRQSTLICFGTKQYKIYQDSFTAQKKYFLRKVQKLKSINHF